MYFLFNNFKRNGVSFFNFFIAVLRIYLKTYARQAARGALQGAERKVGAAARAFAGCCVYVAVSLRCLLLPSVLTWP